VAEVLAAVRRAAGACGTTLACATGGAAG